MILHRHTLRLMLAYAILDSRQVIKCVWKFLPPCFPSSIPPPLLHLSAQAYDQWEADEAAAAQQLAAQQRRHKAKAGGKAAGKKGAGGAKKGGKKANPWSDDEGGSDPDDMMMDDDDDAYVVSECGGAKLV